MKKLFTCLVFLLFVVGASAELNPSRVYCDSVGYDYVTVTVPGGQIGYCIMPNDEQVSAWDFLQGKAATEHSYCVKQGYGIKTIKDGKICGSIFSEECAVCVTDNGKEVEVTRLMNLSFDEGFCGDGKCILGETYGTCPQDCLAGVGDGYCDGLNDSICDPDCNEETDPDCNNPGPPINQYTDCIDGDGKCSSFCIGKDSDCNENQGGFGSPDDNVEVSTGGEYPQAPPSIKYTIVNEEESDSANETTQQQDNTPLYVILILLAIAVIYFIYSKKLKK